MNPLTAPSEASKGPYYEFQVHVTAEPLDENYARRRATVPGEVLVQFVVDTLGQPEPTTLCLLADADPKAASQVVAILPSLRFHPAELPRGRRVAQVMQMPFTFY